MDACCSKQNGVQGKQLICQPILVFNVNLQRKRYVYAMIKQAPYYFAITAFSAKKAQPWGTFPGNDRTMSECARQSCSRQNANAKRPAFPSWMCLPSLEGSKRSLQFSYAFIHELARRREGGVLSLVAAGKEFIPSCSRAAML